MVGRSIIKGNVIKIAGGKYKFSKSRDIEGAIKLLTVKRDACGDFFVYLICDTPEAKRETRMGESIGFDFGLKGAMLIAENPKNITIVPLEAATIPASLEDLALGVINANYAIGSGLKIEDALATEAADSLAADTYVNVIVVNEENKDSEKTKALVAALQTDAVKEFIQSTFNGAVQPKF